MKLKSYAITDIGLKRRINQDAFLKDDDLKLYIVADGMGGHRGGEVASQLAVEVIQEFCHKNPELNGREVLDKAINLSCQEIYNASKEHDELTGMGTTVVAILFKELDIFIAQVGDSRVYLLQGSSIWQITEDHSLLNEEIRSGRLAANQAESYQFKNVITRSVGYESHVQVDIYHRQYQVGDKFLLCTDGLCGLIDSKEMAKIIQENESEEALKILVGLANQKGGDDNITALIVEVLES